VGSSVEDLGDLVLGRVEDVLASRAATGRHTGRLAEAAMTAAREQLTCRRLLRGFVGDS